MQQYVMNQFGFPSDMFILSPNNSPPIKNFELKFLQSNAQAQYYPSTPLSPMSPSYPSSPSIPIVHLTQAYPGYQFVLASPAFQNLIMSQEKLNQTPSVPAVSQVTATQVSSQTTMMAPTTTTTTTTTTTSTSTNKSPPNTTINIKVVSPSQAETTIEASKKEVDSDGDETEGELNEVVEESKDGRWSKRNESVSQRDVPGIDHAYLAMDTEYGFEVVWNEIKLSGGKKFKNQNLHNDEMEIDRVFKNLINLNHSNIVKFHDYWIDKRENDPRIIFITEYMSSGSLKQFLRKAKRTNQSIKKSTWKRWCVQLLTALDYMHKCDPPVVHGDLSCDTIFIQHNGLIKIGSIAPDIVNTHVKTCIDVNKWSRHMHYMAPELKDTQLDDLQTNNPAVDIYAFGMVALEMFNLEFGGNGDTHAVTPELIKQSIEALDEKQQDFIHKCIQTDAKKRPTAKDLLFHPLLFEIPTLKLFAAHSLIKNHNEINDTKLPEYLSATSKICPEPPKNSQMAVFDVNKYLEDVKNGLFPLIVVALNHQSNEELKMSCPSTSSVQSTLSPNSNFSLTSSSSSKSSSSTSSPSQSLSAMPIPDQFDQLETILENHHQSQQIQQIQQNQQQQQQQNELRTQSPILVQTQNGAIYPTLNPSLSNENGDNAITNNESSNNESSKIGEKRHAQQIDTSLTLDEIHKIYKLSVHITFDDRTARFIQSPVNKTDKVNDLADELIAHGLVNELDKEVLIKRLGNALNKFDPAESESLYAGHQNQML